MKKIIALVATMVAAVSFATAEITVGARGIFGLNVGSSLEGADLAVGNSLTFGGALFANIPLAEAGPGAIALQPELGFTHNSIGSSEDTPLGDADMTFSINTIDIAALVGYNIKASDAITITPLLGIQASIVAGDGHAETELDGTTLYEVDGEVDASVLVSIPVGAEFMFKVGPGAIVADVRYNIGLNEIDTGMTLRGLRLGVGYGIQF